MEMGYGGNADRVHRRRKAGYAKMIGVVSHEWGQRRRGYSR